MSANQSGFSLEQLETPTTITDLLERFSKFEFSMTERENGTLIRENQIAIRHAGKEEINGTSADKVIIQGSGSDQIPEAKIWFNGEEIVKIILDNQELPPAMAQDLMGGILSSALAPFMYFREYDLEDAEEFKTADVNNRKRTLAGKEVQVIEYDMESLDEYSLKSGVISVAEFEDFLLLENYNVVTLDDIEINYRLEEVEF